MLQWYFICNHVNYTWSTILGPLLFILYINDLANVSENLFSILFADDTTVLIEGTNINTMILLLLLMIATLNCELAK